MQRTRVALASIAIAAVFLSGCGKSDEQKRTAFETFLQTRVLDKPGIHVPRLTDDEKASFGAYADQYAIITDFNETMDHSISPKMTDAMSAGSITSLQDVVDHVAKIQAAKAGIDAMGNALNADIAKADAAHAKLDQPADVKKVYDKAFDRLVTQPATAFKSIVPVMDTVLGEAIDLAQYLDKNRSGVRISGPMVETSDPAIQSVINEKLRALQGSQQAVQAAQARMQAVVYGS